MARFARLVVVPTVLPPLTRLTAFRRLLFRTVSQINVNYCGQSLASGEAGKVKAGDRLPWVKAADNFAPSRSLAWRGQVHGEPGEGVPPEHPTNEMKKATRLRAKSGQNGGDS